MSEGNLFQLKVITPEKMFFDGEVSMVEFNTTEGELGIYKGHIPLTVIVDPGILTITTPEGPKNAALHAAAKERAEERLAKKGPDIDIDRATIALKKAICRLNAIK